VNRARKEERRMKRKGEDWGRRIGKGARI